MSNPPSHLSGDAPARAAESAVESGLPDAQRLQGQLASLVEQRTDLSPVGEIRPLLDFLRALLNARAVALLPVRERADLVSCVVTTRGVLASSLAAVVPALDPRVSAVQPAPALGADGYTLAVPVRHEDEPLYWLLAQLVVPNPHDLQAFLILLQTLAGFLLYREQRIATARAQWVLERTSGVLEIFRRVGTELDFEKACRIATDDLREFLGCGKVTVAFAQRGSLSVRAISGVTRVDPKSPAHQPYEAARHEAQSAAQRIDFTAGARPDGDFPAHEILQREMQAARLLTIPFAGNRGAVLLEWSKNHPPDANAALLIDATAPFVPPLFDLLHRARPNAALFAAQRAWRRLTAQRRRAVLAGLATLIALLAFPFHYTIKADCRLAPKSKRVIAAPFQSQLRKSVVQPGDTVQAGDALAELDNRELKLKEAELTAARERALKQRDRALRNEGEGADFSAAQVADFEARSVGEELELVRRKIALLDVRSPIDGTIIAGDLRRAEGQPVQQGQILFEIAPLDEMLVEIDVPDREISRVRPGQTARIRLEAFAGGRWQTALERVHPQSEQRESRNVFIAEAPIRTTALDLRPGMHGRAAIESDRRPLIWILGHRLWEWIVTTLWW